MEANDVLNALHDVSPLLQLLLLVLVLTKRGPRRSVRTVLLLEQARNIPKPQNDSGRLHFAGGARVYAGAREVPIQNELG